MVAWALVENMLYALLFATTWEFERYHRVMLVFFKCKHFILNEKLQDSKSDEVVNEVITSGLLFWHNCGYKMDYILPSNP